MEVFKWETSQYCRIEPELLAGLRRNRTRPGLAVGTWKSLVLILSQGVPRNVLANDAAGLEELVEKTNEQGPSETGRGFVCHDREKLKVLRACWLLIPVVLFVGMVIYVFSFALDDAFISLRYAENWANGYGPVFNPGEYAEGYTNFLLIFVEMLLFRFGLGDLFYVRIFSILCGIALVGVVEYFTWRRHRSIFAATCAGLLVGTSAPLVLWTVGGLETLLFALLVTIGIILETLWLQDRVSGAWCMVKGLVFFLAALARPDAAIFVAVVVICDLLHSRQRKSWSGFVAFVASFSFLALVYLAWKFHFYGQIIPRPVYTKIPTHNFLYTFATGGARLLSFIAIDLNTIFVVGILYAMVIASSDNRIKHLMTNFPFILVVCPINS